MECSHGLCDFGLLILFFFLFFSFNYFLRLVPNFLKKFVFLYLVKNTLEREISYAQHFYDMKFIIKEKKIISLVPINNFFFLNVSLYFVKNNLKREILHVQHFYNIKFIVKVLRKYYEHNNFFSLKYQIF